MNKTKNIASLKEVTEQLEIVNLKSLFSDLVEYALYKMKGKDIVTAEKIVGDIFEKTVTGVRKWNKAYPFKKFLFLSVKSLVSQYNSQFGQKEMNFDYDFEIDQQSDSDSNDSIITEELKTQLSRKLKEHNPPPDEIEEMVFDSWMDNMKKPREIAEFWEIEITEVYKAVKRLQRKLNPIREFLNSKSDE